MDSRTEDERPEDLLPVAPSHAARSPGAPDLVEMGPSVTAADTIALRAERPPDPPERAPVLAAVHPVSGHTNGHADGGPAGCTPAQMRRFIKSRPWIPMHELRRRFGINGHEDDVTPMAVGPRTLYVGLPEREGRILGELLRGGDVGYELSVDPDTPIVIGVFPMRPVARP